MLYPPAFAVAPRR